MKRLMTIVVLVLFSGAPLSGELSTDKIIRMARDYLGDGETLDGVKSLRFSGAYEFAGGNSGGRIEILLEKPMRQRLELIEGDEIQTKAVDGDDGWRRLMSRRDPNSVVIGILDAPLVREMRANTFENLNFFSGIGEMRGRILNRGKTKKDGRDVYVLVFQYNEHLYFERYFDAATGELISTVNGEGLEIKEVGEIRSGGIRFPERIVSLKDGEILNAVIFEEIAVNEEFDRKMFEIPSFVTPASARENANLAQP